MTGERLLSAAGTLLQEIKQQLEDMFSNNPKLTCMATVDEHYVSIIDYCAEHMLAHVYINPRRPTIWVIFFSHDKPFETIGVKQYSDIKDAVNMIRIYSEFFDDWLDGLAKPSEAPWGDDE